MRQTDEFALGITVANGGPAGGGQDLVSAMECVQRDA